MFFQELKEPFLTDIPVPYVFFEQILPVINPQHSKVYLYGYFLSCSPDMAGEIDNRILATKLKMELDEILEAWDFLEGCGLIKKHRGDESLAWDYSVEFLDLKSIYMSKISSKSAVSTDEMVILAKNSYTRVMFDSIESITKKTLNYNDMRIINEFIKEYSVERELVIEAFSFSVSIKKSKTVASALGILRTWYLDGIRTAEELRLHLENKHKRYTEYRRILSFLGEYRLPTSPERKMMDQWLDNMGFTMEVIESAVGKSVAIKNPNMNYVNGVLKNWHKKYSALPGKKPPVKANKLTQLEFRGIIIDKLGQRDKIISQEEDRYLIQLYNSFSLGDVEIAIKYLQSRQLDMKDQPHGGKYDVPGVTPEEITIEGLTRFLINPTSVKGREPSPLPSYEETKINLSDLQNIVDEKSPRAKATTPKTSTMDGDELERKLIEKRETINKITTK